MVIGIHQQIWFIGKEGVRWIRKPSFQNCKQTFLLLFGDIWGTIQILPLGRNHVPSLKLYLAHSLEKEIKDMLCNFYRCMCLKMLIVDEVQEHMRKVPKTRLIRLKL